jgi:hypothetical protein
MRSRFGYNASGRFPTGPSRAVATRDVNEDLSMSTTIAAPRELIEAFGTLRFPPKADALLQELMDRNNEGSLSEEERAELEALVELSETMSLLRSRALHLLGRPPS